MLVGTPFLILYSDQQQQIKTFETMLADTIDMMVRMLRAGMPVTVAMERVGHEAQEPAKLVYQEVAQWLQLGLPLPSGAFVIEQDHWGRTMRIAEPALRDTAEGEKIELSAGYAFDVTVVRRTLKREGNLETVEVEITNAAPYDLAYELKVPVYGNSKITDSDTTWEKRDGTPLFALKIPANGSVSLRFTATRN